MNWFLIALIGIVIIILLPAIPGIIKVFVDLGTQLYEINERNNFRETAENVVDTTLDTTETWCSIMYDELFELLEDQIIDNPRIKTSKVIYEKVGYLDDCRVNELISYLDNEQRKRFDRMQAICNLNSCTKAVYNQFQGN